VLNTVIVAGEVCTLRDLWISISVYRSCLLALDLLDGILQPRLWAVRCQEDNHLLTWAMLYLRDRFIFTQRRVTLYGPFVFWDSVYLSSAIAFIQCIVDELNYLHATIHYLFKVGRSVSNYITWCIGVQQDKGKLRIRYKQELMSLWWVSAPLKLRLRHNATVQYNVRQKKYRDWLIE